MDEPAVYVLTQQQKERTPGRNENMDELQIHYSDWWKPGLKKLHILWLQGYDIMEKPKLQGQTIALLAGAGDGDKGLTTKGHEGMLLGDGIFYNLIMAVVSWLCLPIKLIELYTKSECFTWGKLHLNNTCKKKKNTQMEFLEQMELK